MVIQTHADSGATIEIHREKGQSDAYFKEISNSHFSGLFSE